MIQQPHIYSRVCISHLLFIQPHSPAKEAPTGGGGWVGWCWWGAQHPTTPQHPTHPPPPTTTKTHRVVVGWCLCFLMLPYVLTMHHGSPSGPHATQAMRLCKSQARFPLFKEITESNASQLFAIGNRHQTDPHPWRPRSYKTCSPKLRSHIPSSFFSSTLLCNTQRDTRAPFPNNNLLREPLELLQAKSAGVQARGYRRAYKPCFLMSRHLLSCMHAEHIPYSAPPRCSL